MKKPILEGLAVILGGMLLIIVGSADAEDLREVAFEDVSPYWEKQEEQWRPSQAMVQTILGSLEPGDRAEIELRFRIESDGEVDNIQVVEASHDGLLEEMTRERVNQMEFRPGDDNPESEPVIVRFEEHFNRH